MRENNLSKAARNFSPIVSFTPEEADICLNGANNVFTNNPIEKKSSVFAKLSFARRSLLNHPLPYHHLIIDTINIIILYHDLALCSDVQWFI